MLKFIFVGAGLLFLSSFGRAVPAPLVVRDEGEASRRILNRATKISLDAQLQDCIHLKDYHDPVGLLRYLSTDNSVERAINPYLFHIEKGGRQSWLLGTYHMLPWTCFEDKVRRILASCQSLVTESGPQKACFPAVLTGDADEWQETIGEPFLTLLEICYNRCRRYLKKPLFQDLSLAGAYAVYMGVLQEFGMEGQLEGEIHGIHCGLETTEEVIKSGHLDRLSVTSFHEFLQNNAKHRGLLNTPETQNDIREWLRGTLRIHKNLCAEGSPHNFRNKIWLRKFPDLFEALPFPLFAVGAAHLFGPCGLVKGLQHQGYRIRPYAAHPPSLELVEF